MRWVTLAIGLVLGTGCQTTPASHIQDTVLVTFPVERFSEITLGGSSRAYHGGDSWAATLHTRNTVRRFARHHNLIQLDAWAIRPLGMYCVLFSTTGHSDIDRLIADLRRDQRSADAQRNHTFTGMVGSKRHPYDDPLFDIQYGSYTHRLEALHQVTRGAHVKLGLIDSGVDDTHPDLVGQVRRHYAFSGPDAGKTHGTAVAGVISALGGNGKGLVGIAPQAEMYAYESCRETDGRTLCDSFAIAKAVAHALDDSMQVLNISLAGPHDRLLESLLVTAMDRGVVVVAASNPACCDRNFPASLAGVHAAGARPLWIARTEQISTQAGGGYQVYFGPSIASAGLSGAAALLRSVSTAQTTNVTLELLLGGGCASGALTEVTRLHLQGLCE